MKDSDANLGESSRENWREHLVVIGNGMAAIRLVEELVRRKASHRVTVIGDEPGPAYNRILLSALLEGSHPESELRLRSTRWYADNGVALLTGTRVDRIDRDARVVWLADERAVRYDRLVLATGSVPALPPIRGLVGSGGDLSPRVHAFRSMSDCHALMSALPLARRAVVIGGGLLGLQVSRALGVRGLEVDLVEAAPHLLASHIGEQAGAVLRRSLEQLGCEVYPQTRAVRLTDEGLLLDTGFLLRADLFVLTAGARPAISLATAAGLFVRRGVVVDDTLTTVSDERVHAIGDCGEHRGRTSGFVSPAWEQAAVLAGSLCDGDDQYRGSRVVARLRASDLQVAVLGDPERTAGDVVEVANPIRGAYRKVVVRDGVVEAAVLVGDLSRIGLLTQLYDRRTVLGAGEPGQLILGERPPGEGSLRLPDDVEICACAGVSAGRIRACADLSAVVTTTRATTGCGGCASTVTQLLASRHARPIEAAIAVQSDRHASGSG
jgi:NAD(P)H-nitrite reductase large subunit